MTRKVNVLTDKLMQEYWFGCLPNADVNEYLFFMKKLLIDAIYNVISLCNLSTACQV